MADPNRKNASAHNWNNNPQVYPQDADPHTYLIHAEATNHALAAGSNPQLGELFYDRSAPPLRSSATLDYVMGNLTNNQRSIQGVALASSHALPVGSTPPQARFGGHVSPGMQPMHPGGRPGAAPPSYAESTIPNAQFTGTLPPGMQPGHYGGYPGAGVPSYADSTTPLMGSAPVPTHYGSASSFRQQHVGHSYSTAGPATPGSSNGPPESLGVRNHNYTLMFEDSKHSRPKLERMLSELLTQQGVLENNLKNTTRPDTYKTYHGDLNIVKMWIERVSDLLNNTLA